MLIDGWILYKKFVIVFESRSQILNEYYYFAMGWLPPLVIVVTAYGINPSGFGGSTNCWINGGTLWAFYAPVIVVLSMNVFMFVAIIKSIWQVCPGYERYVRGTRGMSGVREVYPGYERYIRGTRGISGVREVYPGYEAITGYERYIRGMSGVLGPGYGRYIQRC